MRVLIALLLVAAGLAAAAPTSIEMGQSQCYDCHAPGLWLPPMTEPAIMEYRFVPDGTTWWLEADVLNTWRHDLRGVSGLLDTSDHAGLSVLPRGNGTSQTLSGSLDPQVPSREQSGVHMVEVPPEAQSLHVALRHDARLSDVRMEVFPPGADEPCRGVRHTDLGATVSFRAEDLAGTGAGTWTVQVTRAMGVVPEPVEYTLHVDIGMEPDAAAIAWAPDAAPGNVSTLRWPVDLAEPAVAPLGLKLQYTSYYQHEAGEPDTEFLYMLAEVGVSTEGGSPSFTQVEVEPEDESVPALASMALAVVLAGVAVWRRR